MDQVHTMDQQSTPGAHYPGSALTQVAVPGSTSVPRTLEAAAAESSRGMRGSAAEVKAVSEPKGMLRSRRRGCSSGGEGSPDNSRPVRLSEPKSGSLQGLSKAPAESNPPWVHREIPRSESPPIPHPPKPQPSISHPTTDDPPLTLSSSPEAVGGRGSQRQRSPPPAFHPPPLPPQLSASGPRVIVSRKPLPELPSRGENQRTEGTNTPPSGGEDKRPLLPISDCGPPDRDQPMNCSSPSAEARRHLDGGQSPPHPPPSPPPPLPTHSEEDQVKSVAS